MQALELVKKTSKSKQVFLMQNKDKVKPLNKVFEKWEIKN